MAASLLSRNVDASGTKKPGSIAARSHPQDGEPALPGLQRHGEVVHLAEGFGGDAVVRPAPLLPVLHEPGVLEHAQVEREARLRGLEPGLQVADALLAAAQLLEDAEARLVGERVEERG